MIKLGIKFSEIKNPQARALIEAALKKCGHSEPERNRRRSLVRKRPFAQGMVNIAGPLLVRIVRVYTGKRYDDDNFSGGCKQLRDAIAAALSRKGDNEENGLWWEYEQKIGDPEIRIEIFSMRTTP